jgi:hypothetical protein
LIDKDDSLGCSKNFKFKIELIDEECKPVCHTVRICSKIKQEFVDEEINKLLKAGIIEPHLGEW